MDVWVHAHTESRLSVAADRHGTTEISQTYVPILDVLALSSGSSSFRPQGRVNEVTWDLHSSTLSSQAVVTST